MTSTKSNTTFLILLIVYVVCFFSSCELEKEALTHSFSQRKYTKGHYFNLSKKYSNPINKQTKSIDYNNLLASVDNSIKHKNEEILLEDNLYEISKEINNLIDKKHKKRLVKKITKLAQFINTDKQDSVEIITTNGRVYRGIVVKSDYEGYFIRLSPEREIYISNNEIKRLTVLTSDNSNLKEDSAPIQQSTEDYFTGEVEEENQYAEDEPVFVEKKLETMSLLSFIFGILGFLPLPVIGGLGWIAAIVLAKSGMNKIDQEPNKYKGKGLAVAGRTLGLIGLTLTAIALIVILLLLIALI